MDASGIAAICGAAFLTGFSKSGMPGMGILIPTLAAMAMPARASTGFILPVLIEGDCVAVGYWRRKAAWPSLLRVLPWTALGIVAGDLVQTGIDHRGHARNGERRLGDVGRDDDLAAHGRRKDALLIARAEPAE